MLWGRLRRPQHPTGTTHSRLDPGGTRCCLTGSGSRPPCAPCSAKEKKDCGSALHGSRSSRSGMTNVTTATAFPPLCRHACQHGQKCEAQEVSWARTHKQREAWLRPRPRITGRSAEKLARIGGTSACWVQYITERTEGGAMHHLREGFSFFLANSHNRGLG